MVFGITCPLVADSSSSQERGGKAKRGKKKKTASCLRHWKDAGSVDTFADMSR